MRNFIRLRFALLHAGSPAPAALNLLRLCTATAALWAGLSHQAQADVTLTDCSAAELSFAVARGGTVLFGCSGTIALARPIEVVTDTVLDANGQRVVLSGSTNTQLFRIHAGVEFALRGVTLVNGRNTNGGAIFNSGTLAVSDCVFSNNIALGPNGSTGRDGSDSRFKGEDGDGGSDGSQAGGGAIYNVSTALVTRCTFLTNGVFAGNGGRGGQGGNGVSIGGNGGNGGRGGTALGGAIFSSGRLRVTNCLFQFNYVVGGDGGAGGTNGIGIPNGERGNGGGGGVGAGGAVYLLERGTVVGTTFDRNFAFSGDSIAGGTGQFVGDPGKDGPDSQGGAICNQGTNTVINCTFSSNGVASGRGASGASSPRYGGEGGNGGSAWGGGYYNAGRASLTNCTLVGGTTLPAPGGQGGTGPVPGDSGDNGRSRGGNVANNGTFFLLQNCLLASAMTGTNLSFTSNLVTGLNAFGDFTDGGYNLSDDSTPVFTFETSRNAAEPLLGLLGNHGGPTPTIPLLPGSPAIDQIPDGFPLTDQRGIPRPVRKLADIGAYEDEGLTISGRVTFGAGGLAGVTVAAGQKTAMTDANGNYTIYGLGLGAAKTVIPSLAGYSFDPPSTNVTVTLATSNVNFRSQRLWIAIAITNRLAQVSSVGIPAQDYQIQASTNLASPTNWQTLGTLTAGSNGVFQYLDLSSTNLPSRFYRIRETVP
jgi:hypothetical protein